MSPHKQPRHIPRKIKDALAPVKQLLNRLRAGITPPEFVQTVVEEDFDKFLSPSRPVRRILIVGGFRGEELRPLRRNYPGATVTVFEPVPEFFSVLERRYGVDPRVHLVQAAVSDQEGSIEFRDTNHAGTGSLFQPTQTAFDWHGIKQLRSLTVRTTTLDAYCAGQSIDEVDLLWVDAQGAEGLVLAGGQRSLAATRAVMLEGLDACANVLTGEKPLALPSTRPWPRWAFNWSCSGCRLRRDGQRALGEM